MVDVTTRHFRFLMRLLTKRTVLWTPMFYARRIATRKRHVVDNMLRFHPSEGEPVAQLGGDDAKLMVAAARRCEALGYGEVNINLGCPAGSATSERFGAALMLPPARGAVVAALRAMTRELTIPVSAKVRIGVDAHDSYEFFKDFVLQLHEDSGINRFVVHARKALLNGLPSGGSESGLPIGARGVTTRQNRIDSIVPLRHEFAHRLKRELPHLHIELNGGIRSLADITAATANGLDGAMLGRLARDNPWFFVQVDSAIFGDEDVFAGLPPLEARLRVVEQYAEYCAEEERGGHEPSREMLLKPLNQLLEGLNEKEAFGTLLRRTPKEARPPLFADELLLAVDSLRSRSSKAHAGVAPVGMERRGERVKRSPTRTPERRRQEWARQQEQCPQQRPPQQQCHHHHNQRQQREKPQLQQLPTPQPPLPQRQQGRHLLQHQRDDGRSTPSSRQPVSRLAGRTAVKITRRGGNGSRYI